MKTLLMISATAIAVIGATPAMAETCSPAVTANSEKIIAGFVEAAKHDYEFGDQAAVKLRERADKYMSERYIQYHPGVESGREPFVQFHVKWYKDHPPQPPKPSGGEDTVVANCHTVLYMHRIPRSHDGHVYQSYLFDMWRVKDGKADEHWDSFFMPWDQMAAGDEDPEGDGMADGASGSRVATTPQTGPKSCDARQLARNRALVALLQGAANGRAAQVAQRVIAAGYVEHNPLLAAAKYQGRQGFVRAAKEMPQSLPGATLRYGMPEIVFADCGHVATVKKIKRFDYKAGGGKTYDSYWFDLWQVKDGRLAQHWDASLPSANYRWNDVDRLNLNKP